MGMRISATCVAILALGVAATTALAGPNKTDDPAPAGHTPAQLEQALKLTGPQDPAITRGLIDGCSRLAAAGLSSEPCIDLLREASVAASEAGR